MEYEFYVREYEKGWILSWYKYTRSERNFAYTVGGNAEGHQDLTYCLRRVNDITKNTVHRVLIIPLNKPPYLFGEAQ